jgi:hypothetical protein
MKKQEAITQVKECISSIFSGEDVIKLIEQIEDSTVTKEVVEQLATDIVQGFKHKIQYADDIVNYDSAEFIIEHDNKLVLDCVDINHYHLEDILKRIVESVISETFIIEEIVSC